MGQITFQCGLMAQGCASARVDLKMAIKKYIRTKEHGIKISESLKGHSVSQEIKLKISNSLKGRHISPETEFKKGQTSLRKDVKLTEEIKKKIKENHAKLSGEKHPMFGKHHSKETLDKIKHTFFKNGQIPWNKGKKYSEKTREKIRHARMKQKFPLRDTSIELKVKFFLDQLKVPYKTHKAIMGMTQPDFFIEPNICIYCDGDYWHKLPNVVEKDKKINETLKFAGYRVIRLWENEINSMHINDFRRILEEVVENEIE